MMTKFNVGDKVRVLDAKKIRDAVNYGYTNGGVYDVTYVRTNGIPEITREGGETLCFYKEELPYIELVAQETQKSARITALETEVSALKAKVEALEKAVKFPLTARFDAETTAKADAILADIKRKATPQQKTQSPNEQRADVIKRAKAFIEESKVETTLNRGRAHVHSTRICDVEFHVNSDKRTVVSLLRWRYDNSVVAKGIAKCDPSDVFNADIGKAIALGRALGVDVTEFTKAVQPTEIVVGQRIHYTRNYPNLLVIANGLKSKSQEISVRLATAHASSNRIIEDTDADYVGTYE